MALVVETGAGVPNAEAYADVAFVDAYWAARSQSAFATAWAALALTTAKREGAIREATAFLDANFGRSYRGRRVGYAQGLEWPRNGGVDCDGEIIVLTDAAGIELPALPYALKNAVAELAARAISAPLARDIDPVTRVKALTTKVGPIEKTTQYFDTEAEAPSAKYGFVTAMLAAILNGAETGATTGNWSWR